MSIIGTLAAQPATIGRYELRERIAHGGMGVLYLAFDPVTEREVALKVLRVDSDDLRERFLREARLAARLQHPNIVTIYDVGAHEDQPFIAMEFIAGETLGQLVHRRAPLRAVEADRADGAGLRRPGLRPPPRHRPSRRQAGQPDDQPRLGRPQGARLRRRRPRRRRPGRAGPDADGDTELHVARAGGRPAVRPSQRHLLGRPGALRAPHLPAGLQRRVAAVDSLEGAARVSPAARRPRSPVSIPACRPSSTGRSRRSADRRYPDLEAMRSDLSRVGQRVLAAETSHDLVGRGTVAARGRGRPGRLADPPAGRRIPPSPPSAGLEPRARRRRRRSSGPGPGSRARPTSRDALAAAERDAYEGRFAAAIRRLEALGPHPEVDAALLHYRQTVAARDAARAQGSAARHHRRDPRPRRRRPRRAVGRTLARGAGAAADAGARRAAARRRGAGGRAPPDAPATAHDGRPDDPVAEREPPPMRRDDEVAHYLSRARRRLEAGDVTAAQSLLDAALDVTRTP